MLFLTILISTTLSIALVAAYFSIIGLAAIFSGIYWPVVIMGSVLEVGKLVAASYVYRFRNDMSVWLKTYLILAILVLMLITSIGIFGMLAGGYQKDMLAIKLNQQQIVLLSAEKDEAIELKQERMTRRSQIDADIANLPNNFVTGRQRLMESYGPELKQLRIDVAEYTEQIKLLTLQLSNIKSEMTTQQVHIGPIIFIAKAAGIPTDDATKYLILLIIIAFDPLAVCLTIGANIALERRQRLKLVDTATTNSGDSPDIPTSVTSKTADELLSVLEDYENRPLQAHEIAYKSMVEEMLARKQLTERIRSHK